MKYQKVSVDYWYMAKSMLSYGVLAVLVWIMLRLFNTALALPRRLRAQQYNMENALRELQARYPELNITEEDMKNADKDLEEFLKGEEDAKAVEDSPQPETNKDAEDLAKPGTSKETDNGTVPASASHDAESKKSI